MLVITIRLYALFHLFFPLDVTEKDQDSSCSDCSRIREEYEAEIDRLSEKNVKLDKALQDLDALQNKLSLDTRSYHPNSRCVYDHQIKANELSCEHGPSLQELQLQNTSILSKGQTSTWDLRRQLSLLTRLGNSERAYHVQVTLREEALRRVSSLEMKLNEKDSETVQLREALRRAQDEICALKEEVCEKDMLSSYSVHHVSDAVKIYSRTDCAMRPIGIIDTLQDSWCQFWWSLIERFRLLLHKPLLSIVKVSMMTVRLGRSILEVSGFRVQGQARV
ncbi:hypothetical protein BKA93DRAFT_747047 [Sparassis latifolia]